MQKDTPAFANIDAYIALQPDAVRPLLQQFREAIRKGAPEAQETISYQMPAFKFHGMLVYFAAWKNHIGFYPVSSGVSAFKDQLEPYKIAKGTIQFPLDKPLPLALITKIVQFRVKENLDKEAQKNAAKPKSVKTARSKNG